MRWTDFHGNHDIKDHYFKNVKPTVVYSPLFFI